MVTENQPGDLSRSETGKYFIQIISSFNALQSVDRVFVWAFIPAYLSPLLKFSMIASLRGHKQRKLINMAKVTAVFKNGSRQDKDNYSPILVLSIFSTKRLCAVMVIIINIIYLLFIFYLGKSAKLITH